MQFVLVNVRAFLLAVFMAAFSFSAFSNVDYSSLNGVSPNSITERLASYSCSESGFIVDVAIGSDSRVACQSFERDFYLDRAISLGHCDVSFVRFPSASIVTLNYRPKFSNSDGCGSSSDFDFSIRTSLLSFFDSVSLECPDGFSGPLGDDNLCYSSDDLLSFSVLSSQDNADSERCSSLLLDSGNNSSDSLCYTSPNGYSCSVNRVSVSQGSQTYSYYTGASSESLGCTDANLPIFDQQGIGDISDGCITVDGGSFCDASESAHSSTDSDGNTTLDDDCFQSNGSTFCDSSNPDVSDLSGTNSDYFDSNGTCSAIYASSSKGFCEENGGTWSYEDDFQPVQCSSSSAYFGTCSVSGVSSCYSCSDNGGVWSPDTDTDNDLSLEQQQNSDLATLVQSSNIKLDSIEDATRTAATQLDSNIKAFNDSVTSAISNSTDSIVSSINDISVSGSSSASDSEDSGDDFSVTSTSTSSDAFTNLFGEASITSLNSEIETLESEITTLTNSIRTEATSLFSISATSSGYSARSLDTTFGSHDVSVSRFSSLWAFLAGPLLLIASVSALKILLTGKD